MKWRGLQATVIKLITDALLRWVITHNCIKFTVYIDKTLILYTKQLNTCGFQK